MIDYHLPKELIAQSFASPRDSSRMMVVDKNVLHKKFYNIVDYFDKGDVLVLNKTKVVANKISGKKITGAVCEMIVEKKVGENYLCRIKGSHPKLGNKYVFKDGLLGKIVKVTVDEFFVRFNKNVEGYLKKHGKIPLPFYVRNKVSEKRYQTVFSEVGESLAAPTAGLHFTKNLLERLKKKGVKIVFVRLDISFSTFLSVTDENFKKKRLHEEYIEIDKKTANVINNRERRLFVCGTTCLRTLESFSNRKGEGGYGKKVTDLFIYPGYKIKLKPDMIITNFHLPKSSLLMMIAAYIGKKKLMDCYEEAIREKYRFYSLGDCMLIENSHPQ